MSRSLWRCRSRVCPDPHGAVLGRLTADGGLFLDPAVWSFRCYLDTRRAVVVCPRCGAPREFRGTCVVSAGPRSDDAPAPPAVVECGQDN